MCRQRVRIKGDVNERLHALSAQRVGQQAPHARRAQARVERVHGWRRGGIEAVLDALEARARVTLGQRLHAALVGLLLRLVRVRVLVDRVVQVQVHVGGGAHPVMRQVMARHGGRGRGGSRGDAQAGGGLGIHSPAAPPRRLARHGLGKLGADQELVLGIQRLGRAARGQWHARGWLQWGRPLLFHARRVEDAEAHVAARNARDARVVLEAHDALDCLLFGSVVSGLSGLSTCSDSYCADGLTCN